VPINGIETKLFENEGMVFGNEDFLPVVASSADRMIPNS
jgi:hypothetical protein